MLNKNILIVDDEVKIVDVVKSFLESKGFTVFSAENGEKALDIFEAENISLILLDLMLPGLSGEQICRIIRQKSRAPIIMLTAKVEESDVLNGLGIGADDYITKPFSLKLLLARVETVLRRSFDEALYTGNSFYMGDLEMDFESRIVKKKNEEVKLTVSEFNIVSALIKYPKKAFTRDELISIALSNEFDGYDRIVDSHIKNIRQKIEDDPKNPFYILTVHGVGYKFGGISDV